MKGEPFNGTSIGIIMAIDQIISLGSKNVVALELAGQIVELDYPRQVPPNIPFDISYGAKNISTTSYTFFGFIKDELGNIIPETDWVVQIAPDITHYPATFTHLGITESITLILTLGHIEIAIPEICDWIILNGGYDNLSIAAVFIIIDAYLFNVPPPQIPGEPPWTFIPTIQNVFGIIDYYLGFDGDAGTGCSFYGIEP